MFVARVIGTVVATAKEAALTGHKLLLVAPLDQHGRPRDRTRVALDAVGVGVGEIVYCCRGREAGFPWLPAETPTDLSIVGVLDPSSNPRFASARVSSGGEGAPVRAGDRPRTLPRERAGPGGRS